MRWTPASVCVMLTGTMMVVFMAGYFLLTDTATRILMGGPKETYVLEGARMLDAAQRKSCEREMLCGLTHESASMDLKSMPLDTLKYLFHGLVTSLEYNCTASKVFGRASYPFCIKPPSIRPDPGDCLVYSIGVNKDWSFDEQFAKYGCEVHSFDPSIGKPDHIHPPNISFHNLGLWGTDYEAKNGWQYKKLASIRKMLGHQQRVIDVLKVDAEGAEWPMLRSVLFEDSDELLTIKQLAIEVHTPIWSRQKRPMTSEAFAEIILYMMELHRFGFRAFYSFLNGRCCRGFMPLFPSGLRDNCCHTISYVNLRFLEQ